MITRAGRLRGFLAAALFALVAPAAAQTRPSILLVEVDDADAGTLEVMRAYGLMPNLQLIVDRGVRFTRAFVSNSVCAPSRYSMLTGRYSTGGVHCNAATCATGEPGSVTALNDQQTWPVWLQAAGYRTGHFGKYLNGYGRDPLAPPTSPSHPGYVPPGYTTWQGLQDDWTYFAYGFHINDNGATVVYPKTKGNHQTRVLTGRAASWISANRGAAPLAVVFTPVVPHFTFDFVLAPLTGTYSDVFRFAVLPDVLDATLHAAAWAIAAQMPFYPSLALDFNEADLSDKPLALQVPLMSTVEIDRAATQYRLRMLSLLAVDDALGQLVAAFGDDPLFVFVTSDNGQGFGQKRRGQKQVAFDWATRVPFYAAGPGVVGPRVDGRLILNHDLAPTFVAIAGATAGAEMDGRSLLPLLMNTAPGWRTRVGLQHWEIPSMFDPPRYRGVRTGPTDPLPNRLLVEWDDALELYDLNVDPGALESKHALPAYAGELAILRAQALALATCHGTACLAAEGF